MAEDLKISIGLSRKECYEEVIPQIAALVENEQDVVANLANIVAALKEALGFFWIGFYIVKGDELVLGPFQGPVACTRIQKGQGVCGKSWKEGSVIIVPDVEQFPGHIACSSQSRSEIVLPVLNQGEVVMVLDVDSDQLNDFSQIDEKYLGEIVQLVTNFIR